jgi:hypothetical protein
MTSMRDITGITNISSTLLRKNTAFGSGRTPRGAFPEVSRTALAKRLGTSKSVVSYVLLGRHEPAMAMLMAMATELGVTASGLVTILAEQKVQYDKRVEQRVERRRVRES